MCAGCGLHHVKAVVTLRTCSWKAFLKELEREKMSGRLDLSVVHCYNYCRELRWWWLCWALFSSRTASIKNSLVQSVTKIITSALGIRVLTSQPHMLCKTPQERVPERAQENLNTKVSCSSHLLALLL